jgi:hypothetical protein
LIAEKPRIIKGFGWDSGKWVAFFLLLFFVAFVSVWVRVQTAFIWKVIGRVKNYYE